MEQSLTFRLEDKIYRDPHIALRVPEFSNYLARYMAGLPVNKSTSLSLITDAKSAKRMICFSPRYVLKIITIISPTEYIHRRVWD